MNNNIESIKSTICFNWFIVFPKAFKCYYHIIFWMGNFLLFKIFLTTAAFRTLNWQIIVYCINKSTIRRKTRTKYNLKWDSNTMMWTANLKGSLKYSLTPNILSTKNSYRSKIRIQNIFTFYKINSLFWD